MNNRLIVLTNIPTPYRISFFNALDRAVRERNGDLAVLFCASIEPNRQWDIRLEEQQYLWKIMPGLHPNLRSFYPHVNPTVLYEISRLRPTWLLVAGAWNTPTMLLPHLPWFAPDAPRIQWSEGHADAVLHPTGPIAGVRRQVLRAYDGFAVPNLRSADFIRVQVGDRRPIVRLPNTVDDDLFDKGPSLPSDVVRTSIGMPLAQRIVTTVAQLEDRKGVRELLDAYYGLSPIEQERLALVLIGEGSLKHELQERIEAQASGHVRLLGHLSQHQVRDVLAASDAFVLPTKQDPNPLSVIEAAFVGLPLFVTRQAGNAYEVVKEGENGAILQSASPEHIITALRKVVQSDLTALRQMGQISQAIARRDFRRDSVAKTFVHDLLISFPPRQ